MIDRQNIINNLDTLSDYIRWSASKLNQADLFFGHGNANALDESAYLVFFTLNLPHDLPSVYFSAKLVTEEKIKIIDIIEKRIETSLPASYITHQANFAGLSFYVDERVLVPRSPIAELIKGYFSPWVDRENVHHILDLCTGSACIAIACAYAFPHAHVDAIDISQSALEVAQINIEKHHAQESVSLIQADLFEHFAKDSFAMDAKEEGFAEKYDIIVSNPPYVDRQDMDDLPTEFLAEPRLGLAAGDEGLDIVIPILQQAKKYLSKQGVLVIEVGNSQYALEQAFPEVPFYWLEFEHGGEGVFLLTYEQLSTYFS